MMVKGFGFKALQKKQSEKGATLIEAALFTVLALGTIIGGIVFFQQASISAKTNEMVRTMASLQTQVRALFQTQATFGTTGINSLLIASNAAPSNILEDSDNDGTMDALVHGFGGSITVTGATRQWLAVHDKDECSPSNLDQSDTDPLLHVQVIDLIFSPVLDLVNIGSHQMQANILHNVFLFNGVRTWLEY